MSQIGEGILNPLLTLWNSTVSVLPGIIAAILILIVGYLIALIIGSAIKHLIRFSRVDDWMARHGKEKAIGGLKLSNVTGSLVKWLVFLVFLIPAANVIKLENLSSVLTTFALWFPNLILAVIITLVGLVLAHTVAEAVGQAKKLKGIHGVKTIVYIATLFIFLDIALRQIGVNIVFAEAIVLVVLIGIMLAIAIGFGLGLRPHAEDIIKNWRRKFR